MGCCLGEWSASIEHYRVATDATELTARKAGRLRKTALLRSDLPGVGDFVALRPALGDGPATIEAVLPRTSALIREAAAERRPQLLAANIDVVFIMTALDGDFSLPPTERYLELVWESGAAPVIVVNKADLKDDATGLLRRSRELLQACQFIRSAHAFTMALVTLSNISRLVGAIGSGKAIADVERSRELLRRSGTLCMFLAHLLITQGA